MWLSYQNPKYRVISCGPQKKISQRGECETVTTDSDSNWEDIESEQDCEDSVEDTYPTIDVNCEDWAEKFTNSIHKFHNSGNYVYSIIDEHEEKCPNCDRVFTPHHQCWETLLSVRFDLVIHWRRGFALVRAILIAVLPLLPEHYEYCIPCLFELHISERKKKMYQQNWLKEI